MSKKKKEETTTLMKCAVCTSCYRYKNSRSDRCHFGGPYYGYVQVE